LFFTVPSFFSEGLDMRLFMEPIELYLGAYDELSDSAKIIFWIAWIIVGAMTAFVIFALVNSSHKEPIMLFYRIPMLLTISFMAGSMYSILSGIFGEAILTKLKFKSGNIILEVIVGSLPALIIAGFFVLKVMVPE